MKLSIVVVTSCALVSNAAAATITSTTQLRGNVNSDTVDERRVFQNRIVGGTQAAQGEFPYFVGWYGCGASLIYNDIILSAAHCNVIQNNNVIVGAYTNGDLNGGGAARTIKTRKVHPNYDGSSNTYDYLVMKLSSPVSYTPVALNGNVNDPAPNEQLTVIGFGVQSETAQSEPYILRKVTVPYVDTNTCGNELGELLNGALELCAGQSGKDSCQGDSGGPIMDSHGVQVGIVSYGAGCAEPNRPGVYSRVSGAIDWINQQICLLSSNPPASCFTPTKPVSAPVQVKSFRPTISPVGPPRTQQPTLKQGTATVPVNVPPGFCLSGINTVEVQGKGLVPIKNLQIGDNVKDASGNMVNVYSFGHYQPNSKAEYLQIHIQGGKPLEITRDHLLFLNGTAVPASVISVGDRIDMVGRRQQGALVHKIREVHRTGAYAPFTTSGTILVNGVAVSSYVTLQTNSQVLVLGGYQTPFTMHWLAHVFQTPHRWLCSKGIEYCRTWETYNNNGISKWVQGPLQIALWLVRQNGVVMTVIFIPVLLLGIMLYAMEQASSWVSLVILLGTACYYSKTFQKRAKGV